MGRKITCLKRVNQWATIVEQKMIKEDKLQYNEQETMINGDSISNTDCGYELITGTILSIKK